MSKLRKEKVCLGFLYMLECTMFQLLVVKLTQDMAEQEMRQGYIEELHNSPSFTSMLRGLDKKYGQFLLETYMPSMKDSSSLSLSTFALTFFSAVNMVLSGVQVFLVVCFAGFSFCGEFYYGIMVQRLWTLFKVVFSCTLVAVLYFNSTATPVLAVDSIALLVFGYTCYQFLHIQMTEGWIIEIANIASETNQQDVLYQPVKTEEDEIV